MSLSLASRRTTAAAARRTAVRRFESNVPKEMASNVPSKLGNTQAAGQVQQGLSRLQAVGGSALSAAENAAKNIPNALSRVGGRTARAVGFVQRQVPRVVYYTKVVAELGKIVFHGQKMAPPPVSTFQSYFQNGLNLARNPSALAHIVQKSTIGNSQTTLIERMRNVSRAQLVTGGVVFAEVLGFFTVGEMIGRFKLIGYRSESLAHHH